MPRNSDERIRSTGITRVGNVAISWIGGEGEGVRGKNFISRGAVSRNSLHKTVGDIRDRARSYPERGHPH